MVLIKSDTTSNKSINKGPSLFLADSLLESSLENVVQKKRVGGDASDREIKQCL